VLKKKLDRMEKPLRVLYGRGKPNLAKHLSIGGETNATALGTRIDRQNMHALL
jgi:hypothetical protein